MNKSYAKARIIRWLLLLRQFNLTIVDKLKKHNVDVDFLPRLTLYADEEVMDV